MTDKTTEIDKQKDGPTDVYRWWTKKTYPQNTQRQIDSHRDRMKNGRTDTRINRQTDRWTVRQRETQLNGRTDRKTDERKDRRTDRWQGCRTQVLTWAFIYSTLLGLVIVRATAFPTTKGRWVCTGTSAFSDPSTTEFVTGRPKAPSTPASIHCNRDNLKLSNAELKVIR